jgi:hypothetical protein
MTRPPRGCGGCTDVGVRHAVHADRPLEVTTVERAGGAPVAAAQTRVWLNVKFTGLTQNSKVDPAV